MKRENKSIEIKIKRNEKKNNSKKMKKKIIK